MMDDKAVDRPAEALPPVPRCCEQMHFNLWLERILPQLLAHLAEAHDDGRLPAEFHDLR